MKRLICSGGFLNKNNFILSGLLRSEAADIENRLMHLPVKILNKWVRDGIWYTYRGIRNYWDHLMGFPFFKPLYSKDAELFMHRCPFQKTFVETMLSKVMTPPNFPVRYADIRAKIEYEQACPTSFILAPFQLFPSRFAIPTAAAVTSLLKMTSSLFF